MLAIVTPWVDISSKTIGVHVPSAGAAIHAASCISLRECALCSSI
jgi:hypothetical protein